MDCSQFALKLLVLADICAYRNLKKKFQFRWISYLALSTSFNSLIEYLRFERVTFGLLFLHSVKIYQSILTRMEKNCAINIIMASEPEYFHACQLAPACSYMLV